VLLVDDEPDVLLVMKLGMRRHGFAVDAFTDPKLALSQFKPNYYDAIVLDMRMPGLTGFELARKIWAKDQKARVCFCSAFETYEKIAKETIADYKAHCFIKKPIMPSELAKHIKDLLLPAE
jgi:DNA-binding response OmpR family regulator